MPQPAGQELLDRLVKGFTDTHDTTADKEAAFPTWDTTGALKNFVRAVGRRLPEAGAGGGSRRLAQGDTRTQGEPRKNSSHLHLQLLHRARAPRYLRLAARPGPLPVYECMRPVNALTHRGSPHHNHNTRKGAGRQSAERTATPRAQIEQVHVAKTRRWR
jgi:hypothetical protein